MNAKQANVLLALLVVVLRVLLLVPRGKGKLGAFIVSSLQEQLLKAGLTDAKTAKAVNKEKRKQAKANKGHATPAIDEIKQAARQAAKDKADRARAMNAERDAKASHKAINAQIAQLITTHQENRTGGDVSFNFTDGKKIKKLLVTPHQQARLISGLLKIVKRGDAYAVIPAPIADKIAQRDPKRIINCRGSHEPELTEEEKDWYKDFEIPDDLDW